MIAANSKVFARLDDFCAIQSDPIRNAGKKRFIATNAVDKLFLKNAIDVVGLSLAPGIKLAHYAFDGRSFIVCSGLEVSEAPEGLEQTELDGGVLTTFLSDQALSPSASAAEIRDVVEADDLDSNPAFLGFTAQAIAGLFPVIQVFTGEQLEEDESFKAFFLLSASSRPALQLRNDQFNKTIRSLAELSSHAVPYETLCRSVLDSDPSSMFLALYRCLEALYAYSHCESLKATLKLDIDWPDLALSLEDVLGWRPREEPSLSALINYAEPKKLQRLVEILDDTPSEQERLCDFAAKRIYRLRNSVVHYRAFQQHAVQKQPEWESLTEALAVLIFDIYAQVPFGRVGQMTITERVVLPIELADDNAVKGRTHTDALSDRGDMQLPRAKDSYIRGSARFRALSVGITISVVASLFVTFAIGGRSRGK